MSSPGSVLVQLAARSLAADLLIDLGGTKPVRKETYNCRFGPVVAIHLIESSLSLALARRAAHPEGRDCRSLPARSSNPANPSSFSSSL